MKTMLILLAMIVIVGVSLGFYLGWFNFSSSDDKDQANVTLSVDKEQVETDKEAMVDTAQDLGRKAADKIEETPQNTPN